MRKYIDKAGMKWMGHSQEISSSGSGFWGAVNNCFEGNNKIHPEILPSEKIWKKSDGPRGCVKGLWPSRWVGQEMGRRDDWTQIFSRTFDRKQCEENLENLNEKFGEVEILF